MLTAKMCCNNCCNIYS